MNRLVAQAALAIVIASAQEATAHQPGESNPWNFRHSDAATSRNMERESMPSTDSATGRSEDAVRHGSDRGESISLLVIAEDDFDSYSASGNFDVDGGDGWADEPVGWGFSTTPGLTGHGKALDNPVYTRLLDLNGLGDLLVDPFSVNPSIGGSGVVVWASFWMRTDDTAGGFFNAEVRFASSEYHSAIGNAYVTNQVVINSGTGNDVTVVGSDLSSTTKIVVRFEYDGDRTGKIEIWLNPTATTEAGLGSPDATTPGINQNGFVESFDRIQFFGQSFEVDDFRIGASYEALFLPLFTDGFESGGTTAWN